MGGRGDTEESGRKTPTLVFRCEVTMLTICHIAAPSKGIIKGKNANIKHTDTWFINVPIGSTDRYKSPDHS